MSLKIFTHYFSNLPQPKPFQWAILLFAGAFIGMGALQSHAGQEGSLTEPPKNEPKIPPFAEPFVDLVGHDTIQIICLDSTWLELCDRAGEFGIVAKNDFVQLLKAVADTIHFLRTDGATTTKSTPRLFRARSHLIIEAVRNMHATIEERGDEKLLREFEELAADFQRIHNDYAFNVYNTSKMT